MLLISEVKALYHVSHNISDSMTKSSAQAALLRLFIAFIVRQRPLVSAALTAGAEEEGDTVYREKTST